MGKYGYFAVIFTDAGLSGLFGLGVPTFMSLVEKVSVVRTCSLVWWFNGLCMNFLSINVALTSQKAENTDSRK